MMKRIKVKLHSRAGESIGETLVALLISSLALLMLAGAISTASRLVTQSKASMDEYYTETEPGIADEMRQSGVDLIDALEKEL